MAWVGDAPADESSHPAAIRASSFRAKAMSVLKAADVFERREPGDDLTRPGVGQRLEEAKVEHRGNGRREGDWRHERDHDFGPASPREVERARLAGVCRPLARVLRNVGEHGEQFLAFHGVHGGRRRSRLTERSHQLVRARMCCE